MEKYINSNSRERSWLLLCETVLPWWYGGPCVRSTKYENRALRHEGVTWSHIGRIWGSERRDLEGEPGGLWGDGRDRKNLGTLCM